MTRPLGWWGPVHREAVRRGRIEARAPRADAGLRRPLIRRQWTPEEAQAWTREDWIAIVLSPLVFAGVMFGLSGLLLMQAAGVWTLAAALAAWALLYYAIDPKLRAVSAEYEEKQAAYIKDVERRAGREES
jgi:hypothetical protein